MTDVTSTTPRADPDAAADGFEGGWFRVDDDLEHLDDVVWRLATDADDTATTPGPAAVVVGVAAGVLFTRRQLSRENPMLDMRLFTVRPFTGAVLVNLLAIFSLVGFLYFVSQHLQLVLGLSPLEAGVVLVPGLAVSSTGLRMGQGGGCYDRTLGRVPVGTPVWVLLYDDEVGLDVPAEPHDRSVTGVVSPSGLTRFAG